MQGLRGRSAALSGQYYGSVFKFFFVSESRTKAGESAVRGLLVVEDEAIARKILCVRAQFYAIAIFHMDWLDTKGVGLK